MGWLTDLLMGGPKPEPEKAWRLVGKVVTEGVGWKSSSSQRFKVITLLEMTPNGARRFTVCHSNDAVKKFVRENTDEGCALQAWEAGGPFPETFEPIEDTLGPMLSKLIDAKLTGSSDE